MATFYTGNTGGSTGPHLDFRVYNPETSSYEDPSKFTSYLSSGGNPFDFEVTSGFQPEGRIHPKSGKLKPHYGIDYATEIGTGIDIKGGKLLSTWNDKGGGGIMSQYLVQTENGPREFLMLHGSDQNKITGKGAVTDYDITSTAPSNSTPTTPQQEAVERVQNYANMSKAELDAAYDGMRNDPAKARIEGMKMHKAFFGK
jgi:hypothetical protein